MSDQPHLFDLSEYPVLAKGLDFNPLQGPVWTGNKARLIQRYLRYFTFITKHGTYLDLFAGPQQKNVPDSWAAKLVLDTEPKWLRNFALFELDKKKCRLLQKMVEAQPPLPKRKIEVIKGDMNETLTEYLKSNPIRQTEATFCLIDQHTFECNWETVKLLASHKGTGNKIELFYFLGQGWIDRAVAGMRKNTENRLNKWWGSSGWEELIKKPSMERGKLLASRFKDELRYGYAYSFPIFEKPTTSSCGGRVMFYMVHASDHPEAPKLMFRAYNYAVAPLEPIEQLEIEFAQLAEIDPQ